MFTPCWTSSQDSSLTAIPVHTSLNKDVLGVQFARRPNYYRLPVLKQRDGVAVAPVHQENEEEINRDSNSNSSSSTVLVVSLESSVFIYKTTDIECLKSWIIEGNGKGSSGVDFTTVKLQSKAVLVPGTTTIVCPINNGSHLFHIDYDTPSGSVQIDSDSLSKVDIPVTFSLVHDDLEGIVVLITPCGAVSLHTVADEQKSTSAALSPPKSENSEGITIKVKDAKLIPVTYSKIRSSKKSVKLVAIEWQIVLTEELLSTESPASLRIRTIDIKPKSSMLALSAGSCYSVVVPETCRPSKNGANFDLVSSCIMTWGSMSLIWKNGLCQRLTLTPRKTSADQVSCQSMQPPAQKVNMSKENGAKRSRSHSFGAGEEFIVTSATAIVKFDNAKEGLICYGFSDKSVGLFDTKFAVPLDQSIITGNELAEKSTEEHASVSITIVEQCPHRLKPKSSTNVEKVAFVNSLGSVYLYDVTAIESSLSTALGKLSSVEQPLHDSLKYGTGIPNEKRKWSDAFVKSSSEENDLFKRIVGLKSENAIRKHVEEFVRKNNGSLPYNLAQRLCGFCLERENGQLWNVLNTVIKSRAISVCANETLIPTLIHCNQVGLLFNVLAFVEDVTEKNIADIIMYVLSDAPVESLELLGGEIKKELQNNKEKLDGTFNTIVNPSGYSSSELAVHAILLGAICVPNNQIFMVQMLKKMNKGAIEALFSVLAYSLVVYQAAPDKYFKKHVSRRSRSVEEKDEHKIQLLCPSYTICLRWGSMLLDARFQPIVERASRSKRFNKLVDLVHTSCSDHIKLCETLECLEVPLGQYLKQSRNEVHQFPSDYSVEYVLL